MKITDSLLLWNSITISTVEWFTLNWCSFASNDSFLHSFLFHFEYIIDMFGLDQLPEEKLCRCVIHFTLQIHEKWIITLRKKNSRPGESTGSHIWTWHLLYASCIFIIWWTIYFYKIYINIYFRFYSQSQFWLWILIKFFSLYDFKTEFISNSYRFFVRLDLTVYTCFNKEAKDQCYKKDQRITSVDPSFYSCVCLLSIKWICPYICNVLLL